MAASFTAPPPLWNHQRLHSVIIIIFCCKNGINNNNKEKIKKKKTRAREEPQLNLVFFYLHIIGHNKPLLQRKHAYKRAEFKEMYLYYR